MHYLEIGILWIGILFSIIILVALLAIFIQKELDPEAYAAKLHAERTRQENLKWIKEAAANHRARVGVVGGIKAKRRSKRR